MHLIHTIVVYFKNVISLLSLSPICETVLYIHTYIHMYLYISLSLIWIYIHMYMSNTHMIYEKLKLLPPQSTKHNTLSLFSFAFDVYVCIYIQ